MQVWNVPYALAENKGHNFCRAVSSQVKHISTIGKKLLNSNTSSTCTHNMENFGPLAAETGSRVVGNPSKFQQLSRLAFVSAASYCSDVVHRRPTFGGFCSLTEFCQVQTSLCAQVLSSPILAALLHGTPTPGVSQTLQRGTRVGITELSQRAPPIFGWAAITLDIGPPSSFCCFPSVTIAPLSLHYLLNLCFYTNFCCFSFIYKGWITVYQFTRIECGMYKWQNITDNLSLRQFCLILGYFGKNMVAMATSLRPLPSEMSFSDLRTTKTPL